MTWTCICGAELPDDQEFHVHDDGVSFSKIVFLCLFCGKDVQDEEPLSITAWQESSDQSQTWWSHIACFKQRVHRSAKEGPFFYEPAA